MGLLKNGKNVTFSRNYVNITKLLLPNFILKYNKRLNISGHVKKKTI